MGLQGCTGVQRAASEWLAVHAEYGLRCEYLHRATRTERTATGEDGYFEEVRDTIDRVLVSSPGVRFGLSVYF